MTTLTTRLGGWRASFVTDHGRAWVGRIDAPFLLKPEVLRQVHASEENMLVPMAGLLHNVLVWQDDAITHAMVCEETDGCWQCDIGLLVMLQRRNGGGSHDWPALPKVTEPSAVSHALHWGDDQVEEVRPIPETGEALIVTLSLDGYRQRVVPMSEVRIVPFRPLN